MNKSTCSSTSTMNYKHIKRTKTHAAKTHVKACAREFSHPEILAP